MTTYVAPTYPGSYVAGDQINFNYTGASQTWNSLNSSYIKIELYGAAGGNGGDTPGYGGYSYGYFYPAQNTNYYLYIGGQGGGPYQNTTNVQTSVAGFNGGGEGGLGVSGSNVHRGAGGGGATDFRSGGTALSNRILVAGGGGGSGTRNVQSTGFSGGGAGAGTAYYNQSINHNGNPGYYASGRRPGTGGTQSAGGSGGAYYDGGGSFGAAGSAGTLGVGGQGGNDGMSYTQYNYASAGGGGGYYGGGGGASGGYDGRGNGGGGGGSAYVNAGNGGQIALFGGEAGVATSNGSAVITILA